MFFGISMASWEFDTAPIVINEITDVEISHCEADDLHITSDLNTIPPFDAKTDWTYDTIMHAKYNGSIHAGNVEFSALEVDSIKLKRRKKGTYDWITIFNKTISSPKDFNFEYFDRLCRAKTAYEYSIVSVIGDIEGKIKTNEVYSDFDNLFICEKSLGYQAAFNLKLNHTSNREASVITTIGRKYPYVISNGLSNYVSGTITASFINADCELLEEQLHNSWQYREEVNDFLNNRLPKIIKNSEGEMWLASIVGSPTEDYSNHYLCPIHTIDFSEIGNCEDEMDLINNGLLTKSYEE